MSNEVPFRAETIDVTDEEQAAGITEVVGAVYRAAVMVIMTDRRNRQYVGVSIMMNGDLGASLLHARRIAWGRFQTLGQRGGRRLAA